MREFDAVLRPVLRQIEPTPSQKDGAKRSQNHLRGLFDDGQMGRRIVDSYLSGSYARDTAIYPLDDVDIVFVIDPIHWQRGLLGRLMQPDPDKVIHSFARALRLRYPKSSAFVQRRSVRLEMSHLDIDCVPAIEEEQGSEYILVPDRQEGTWIRSSPKRHQTVSSAVNARCAGRLKPVVKLLKNWNSGLSAQARVRSFLIETMATTLFHHRTPASLSEGLLMFFDFVASFADGGKVFSWPSHYGISMNFWSTSVPDLAQTGANVAGGLDEKRRDRFLDRAASSRNKLFAALSAKSDAQANRGLAKALGLDYEER
jgi:hypothetical protein